MNIFLRILLLVLAGVAAAELFSRLDFPPPVEPPAEIAVTNPAPPPRPPASSVKSPPLQPSPPPPSSPPKPPPPPPPPAPAVSRAQEPPPPAAPELSEREFYERLAPAVIQIFCTTPEELFSASGVILNSGGLTLTNAHVAGIIKKAGESNCQARHGNPAGQFAKLEIVYIASTTALIANTKVAQRDIAFLRLVDAREPFTAAPIEGRAISSGERLYTLGYPSEFLESIAAANNSNLVFSTLNLAGYADVDGDPSSAEGYVFKGGLALQQGSSGSALFTAQGRLAGIIFATTKGATTDEREGIAFTMGYINRVLELELGQGLADFTARH